jgi:2-dehydro-3-deoxygluconokinase
MSAKVVTFGEIMMRLKTPGVQRFAQAQLFEATFGGGEANVAVSLAQFGLQPTFVTALPDNPLADNVVRMMKGFGVRVDGPRMPDSRLGLYFMENGANQRSGQVVYDRTGSAFADLKPGEVNWPTIFDGAGWLHVSGISPAVSASAAAVTLEAVRTAKNMGLTVSLDINHRAKLWRYDGDPSAIMRSLIGLCDVLIAGREDCQKSIGLHGEGDPDTPEYFETLTSNVMKEFPDVHTVAVTIRDTKTAEHHDWAACMRTRTQMLFSRKYEIRNIVDRVGSGDAFAAAIIYGLNEAFESQEALEFAAAANCMKHSIEGDFNLCTVAEVRSLMSGGTAGRVQR